MSLPQIKKRLKSFILEEEGKISKQSVLKIGSALLFSLIGSSHNALAGCGCGCGCGGCAGGEGAGEGAAGTEAGTGAEASEFGSCSSASAGGGGAGCP